MAVVNAVVFSDDQAACIAECTGGMNIFPGTAVFG